MNYFFIRKDTLVSNCHFMGRSGQHVINREDMEIAFLLAESILQLNAKRGAPTFVRGDDGIDRGQGHLLIRFTRHDIETRPSGRLPEEVCKGTFDDFDVV